MNRRDRLRVDERRREANGSHRDVRTSSNPSGNEKNVMDSYFQSQKVIQSLTTLPETDATKTKSFRIPRKQRKPEEHFENRNHSRNRNDTHERRDPLFSDDRRSRVGSFHVVQPCRTLPKVSKLSTAKPAPKTQGQHEVERQNCRTRKYIARRYNKTKPIQVLIFNRQRANGQINAKDVPALVRALTDLVRKSVNADCKLYPRFLGYHYSDGMFLIMCANLFTREFLREKLDTIRPPWVGAKLDMTCEPHKECVCTAVIPDSICHFSEFLALCRNGNRKLITEKWRYISHEDNTEGPGKLTTFGMDPISCEIILENNGLIRCGGVDVEINLKFTKGAESDSS